MTVDRPATSLDYSISHAYITYIGLKSAITLPLLCQSCFTRMWYVNIGIFTKTNSITNIFTEENFGDVKKKINACDSQVLMGTKRMS